MKAVTVRKKADNALVCFGPSNGMYAPGFDPVTMTHQEEPDYHAVLAEWQGKPVVADDRQVAKLALKNVKSMGELLTVLEKLV